MTWQVILILRFKSEIFQKLITNFYDLTGDSGFDIFIWFFPEVNN